MAGEYGLRAFFSILSNCVIEYKNLEQLEELTRSSMARKYTWKDNLAINTEFLYEDIQQLDTLSKLDFCL